MKRTRTKRSRIRGSRTAFTGFRQNYRGKGHMGGRGMAGTGKRAGQRKLWVLKYAPDYFGKHGFTSKRKKMLVINLGTLNEKIEKFVSQGKAKRTETKNVSGAPKTEDFRAKEKEGYEINLKGYKVLSSGKINKKLFIKASGFSDKVKAKIEKAGGSIAKI